jgi:hypothetical protein
MEQLKFESIKESELWQKYFELFIKDVNNTYIDSINFADRMIMELRKRNTSPISPDTPLWHGEPYYKRIQPTFIEPDIKYICY